MASEADHICLANRNHDSLLYLANDVSAHAEWVTTVAFYKAVQVVEAVFANHQGIHSHGHDSRLQGLKHPVFKELFKAFRPLYSASLVARYLEDNSNRKVDGKGKTERYHTFTEYIPHDELVNRLLKRRLDVLEQNAVRFLSEDCGADLKRISNAGLF